MFGRKPGLTDTAKYPSVLMCQVGNISFIIKETEDEIFNYKKSLPYTIFYAQNNSEPNFVQMITLQNRESLAKAMASGATALIAELKSLKFFATTDLAVLLFSELAKSLHKEREEVSRKSLRNSY